MTNPTLKHLLLCSLWGNRSDLSLSSGNVDTKVAQGGVTGKLLVDDSEAAEAILLQKHGKKIVIIILDNCGAELLADLRLSEYLVNQLRCTVVLHVKPHPVFVSDATRLDVFNHVTRLCEEGIRIGETLRQLITIGKVQFLEDIFYTSPLEFPTAPVHLKQQFALASLIIVKGDANYRRILCDRHFPHDFPLVALTSTSTETPLLAIRTCKSPVIVGLTDDVLHSVRAQDPNWCVNGTCGLLQLARRNC